MYFKRYTVFRKYPLGRIVFFCSFRLDQQMALCLSRTSNVSGEIIYLCMYFFLKYNRKQ